jgi:ribosomal-protein-alanine N-acetyltransferase
MVQMQTDRLKLREFTFEDYDGVHAFASDPEVCKYVVWGPNTPSDTKTFLQRSISEQKENPRFRYNLAVVHPTKGVIGSCALNVQSLEYRSASIGYILNRLYWGIGYGTEIARRLIIYGFEDLNMYRMTADCDPQNIASWKVMEKNGMKRDGLLRHNQIIRGEWSDSYIYSILQPEYRAMLFTEK